MRLLYLGECWHQCLGDGYPVLDVEIVYGRETSLQSLYRRGTFSFSVLRGV